MYVIAHQMDGMESPGTGGYPIGREPRSDFDVGPSVEQHSRLMICNFVVYL